jgi:hypothetical protein
MADTIVGGLFGIDPYQRQQEQAKLLNTEALQFAQLDPFQKANYALYSGGAKLGNLGASLMGAQDPQLVAQQTAQQLSSQFDISTPQGLKDYSAALLKAGQEANNPTLSNFGMMALDKARQFETQSTEMSLKKAQTVKAYREPLPDIAKLQHYRTGLLESGYAPDSKEVQEVDANIKAKAEGSAPKVSLDVKMLDLADNRRKSFFEENKPIIEQGRNINQALTLLNSNTPFSEAAFENTVVQAFGGDKQKSKSEIQRLLNTGDLGERVNNSLTKFISGKVSDLTNEDRKNVLTAIEGNIKRVYNSKREAVIKSSSKVKELSGQEDYMAPTYENTVGGGIAQGKPAYTVGQTLPNKQYGTLTVVEVNPITGNPTKVKDSAGRIATVTEGK